MRATILFSLNHCKTDFKVQLGKNISIFLYFFIAYVLQCIAMYSKNNILSLF